jgi:hypothetical protein
MHNLIKTARLRAALNGQLDEELRARRDEFLPAREYLERAGLSHYKDVNVPVGHAVSPWGDWESTLK